MTRNELIQKAAAEQQANGCVSPDLTALLVAQCLATAAELDAEDSQEEPQKANCEVVHVYDRPNHHYTLTSPTGKSLSVTFSDHSQLTPEETELLRILASVCYACYDRIDLTYTQMTTFKNLSERLESGELSEETGASKQPTFQVSALWTSFNFGDSFILVLEGRYQAVKCASGNWSNFSLEEKDLLNKIQFVNDGMQRQWGKKGMSEISLTQDEIDLFLSLVNRTNPDD